MAWDRRAPFNEEGGLMHYADERASPNDRRCYAHEWRAVTEFEATMQYITFIRGRSAAYLVMEDQNSVRHSIFLAEFSDVIPHLVRGRCRGIWTVAKRGQNFGIKLAKDL